jgi:rod shape-determining protein MreC
VRLRKRHAWGAVLIVLFVLPVLKPGGIASIEDPAGGFFAWFSEVVPSPRPWTDEAPAPAAEDDPRLRVLEQENRRLWEHTLQARQRLRAFGELKAALARTQLDRLPPVVLARVTRAHDPVPMRRSILIDRGTSDGVRVGHPVVMGDVYVGRVRVARAHSSLVQLVTDPRSRLEVFVRTSKGQLLRGFARRDGSEDGIDMLRVEFVRLREGMGTVRRGAQVFTSNYDERVPAHLLLGRVRRVSDPDLDRMPTLGLRPALDLDRSTEVMVLLTAEAPARSKR